MEKILLAIDGTKLNTNTIDFACYIANLTRSKLKALFIKNIVGEEKPARKELFALPYVETITSADFPENKEIEIACDENEKIFSGICSNRGIEYHIHFERGALTQDIIAESRFADLVILDPGTSFEGNSEGIPSHFVKQILEQAECPVIIAPYSFDGINEVFFTYDGSKSSVFAIRQFAHLFPELNDKKITVLQVSEKKKLPFEKENSMEELLKSHYSNISFEHLEGKPADELFGYLLHKKNAFVVMGAYGRGALSNLFSRSTADLVVKTINAPFFIAHY